MCLTVWDVLFFCQSVSRNGRFGVTERDMTEEMSYIGARVPVRLAVKLRRLADETRRTQSDVLRILVEQATAEQLGKPATPSQEEATHE